MRVAGKPTIHEFNRKGDGMNRELELQELRERVEKLEERIEDMTYEPRGSRPFWMDFLFAFVTVLIGIMAITGIVLFIR